MDQNIRIPIEYLRSARTVVSMTWQLELSEDLTIFSGPTSSPLIRFHERDDFHILLFASFCLCFNAGFVNTVTMSSYFAMTTSHVTGLVRKRDRGDGKVGEGR